MSKYDLAQIIRMWELAEITADQAIGQILLHIEELIKRLDAIERQVGLK
ncbi:hypothetical protein KFU94_36085 [Chloroflexi bacterium TSY]|nr:hypothetical protein [Chloroflexi bacterium TSY]